MVRVNVNESERTRKKMCIKLRSTELIFLASKLHWYVYQREAVGWNNDVSCHQLSSFKRQNNKKYKQVLAKC